MPAPGGRRRLAAAAVVMAAAAGVVAPLAVAAEPVPASLSDVRITQDRITATLVLRSSASGVSVDSTSVSATMGGEPAKVYAAPAEVARKARSTMLVIDTSGSMGADGMAAVRSAVKRFLAELPKDVKVGVVSFASTSGVDVAPTTDHAKVSRAVGALRSKGETSLYKGVQDAVRALGTKGERSIILLSDGGDTVAYLEGGQAREKAQLTAALAALRKGKVRAEVIAFKSPDSNSGVLKQFASVGGGSVVNAANGSAVTAAFTAAARTLESQAVLIIERPPGVGGSQPILVTGTASGQPFTMKATVDLGETAPVAVEPDPTPLAQGEAAVDSVADPLTALAPKLLLPAVVVVFLGVFLLAVAIANPSFRSRRSERVEAIEGYGFGRARQQQAKAAVNPSAIGEQLVHMGDQLMEGRESTTKTMALLERADLPWRAGEWLVLRMIAVVIAGAAGVVLLGAQPVVGGLIGAVAGLLLPPFGLRFLAKRRSRRFEAVLPDVMMLVATSLSSGFSLLQALDSVAKDAPEPAAKEFSRALAESRIGADISDALEKVGVRMDSDNMRWTTMAIRIQREVGGNLAETLRTTAATLREREMLRRQVRALSAEGRLSAYVLVALPVGLFLYSMWANYDYVSLLWTTFIGIGMLVAGVVSLVVGIFWMRSVVTIEV